MKIALFGATGRTGRHILHAALLDGQQVSVLVRNPAKLTPDRDQVTLFLGDALDAEMVAYSMRECDVVGSALGLADNVEPDALSLATANIVNAMQDNGIQRLVVVAGAGILQDRQGERLRMEAPDLISTPPIYLTQSNTGASTIVCGSRGWIGRWSVPA